MSGSWRGFLGGDEVMERESLERVWWEVWDGLGGGHVKGTWRELGKFVPPGDVLQV